MEKKVYVLEDKIQISEEYMKMTEKQLLEAIAKQLAMDGKTRKFCPPNSLEKSLTK